jgi:hypothetical protein
MKYIHTKYLEAIIYDDGDLKLSVYSIRKSPKVLTDGHHENFELVL